jgi:hypothetical protein
VTTLRILMSVTTAAVWCNVAAADPAPCGVVKPITFETGRAEASIHGGVARGELQCFSLAAKAGQSARLAISSVEGNAVFQFYRPGWSLAQDDGELTVNGQAYPHAANGDDARRWSGRLAATGANLIVVGSVRGGAAWTLHVAIAP